jgi:hypothetical protein
MPKFGDELCIPGGQPGKPGFLPKNFPAVQNLLYKLKDEVPRMRLVFFACTLAAASAFGSNDFYYKHWCGAGLQFLDDAGETQCTHGRKCPSDS